MDVGGLHEQLGLDPGQERFMRASRLKMQGEMDAFAGRLETRKEALASLLAADPVDLEAVREELARMAEIQTSIQEVVVGHFIEARKHLTPGQRKRLDGLLRGRMCPHLCNGLDPRPLHGRSPCGEGEFNEATQGGDGPPAK
jgi:Spy/CpxP family protein refolding chaperone